MVRKSVRDVEVEIELPNAFQDHGPASRMNQLILFCEKMLVNSNIRKTTDLVAALGTPRCCLGPAKVWRIQNEVPLTRDHLGEALFPEGGS